MKNYMTLVLFELEEGKQPIWLCFLDVQK